MGANGKIATSADGETNWTPVSTTAFNNGQIRGVSYCGGTYVAVGNSGVMVESDNGGATWTAVTTTAFNGGQINGVSYGGAKFVAVGQTGSDGVIAYSNRRE